MTTLNEIIAAQEKMEKLVAERQKVYVAIEKEKEIQIHNLKEVCTYLFGHIVEDFDYEMEVTNSSMKLHNPRNQRWDNVTVDFQEKHSYNTEANKFDMHRVVEINCYSASGDNPETLNRLIVQGEVAKVLLQNGDVFLTEINIADHKNYKQREELSAKRYGLDDEIKTLSNHIETLKNKQVFDKMSQEGGLEMLPVNGTFPKLQVTNNDSFSDVRNITIVKQTPKTATILVGYNTTFWLYNENRMEERSKTAEVRISKENLEYFIKRNTKHFPEM